jgi:hypothetical protein
MIVALWKLCVVLVIGVQCLLLCKVVFLRRWK